MTLVAAHRGASLDHPDNSRAAFVAAIEAGADAIETDVRADAAGRLVLSHDPIGAVGAADPLRSPMTLDELLALADGRIGLDLEIKEPEIATALAGAVARWDGWLLISSFHDRALADVRAAAPGAATGLLLEEPSDEGDVLARARACDASALMPEASLLDDPRLADCPLALWTWTVNAPIELARLLRSGRLAGLITDDPAAALAQRAAAGSESLDG